MSGCLCLVERVKLITRGRVAKLGRSFEEHIGRTQKFFENLRLMKHSEGAGA